MHFQTIPIPPANAFLDFFKDKIERIRLRFSPTTEPDPFTNPASPPPTLQNFNPATLEEIRKFVFTSSNSQCKLDVIPTDLLKECFDELGPIITTLINYSLAEGCFPSVFKTAHVRPLLIKASLPPEDLNNYRPISNLNFISKILEKVVANRMNSRLSTNSIAAAIVGSRLDFCNSLLAGTSVSNLTRLQLVQNTLARVVAQKPRFCRITPVLSDLHWLPVRHRISFKIATITFKVLQFQQPSYQASLIPKYVPTRALRSSSSLAICVPPRKTTMANSKSFSSVASNIWNSLPSHLSSHSNSSYF